MGFIKLFSVASFPVIKVLLITALGLFLALDNISILGEDARKKVNQVTIPENLFSFVLFFFIVQFNGKGALFGTACVLCV